MHVGVVLAGGKSTRMGRDKSKLEWFGKDMLAHTIERLRKSGCEQVLVNNEFELTDRYVNFGPLAGIEAALSHIKRGEWLTVMPVDMPFVSESDLRLLHNHAVYYHQGCYFQNAILPCVIPVKPALLCYIREQLDSHGDVSVRALLRYIDAKPLEHSQPQALLNTNTPSEWSNALAIHHEQK